MGMGVMLDSVMPGFPVEPTTELLQDLAHRLKLGILDNWLPKVPYASGQ